MNALAVVQTAALCGVWGVSFLIVLVWSAAAAVSGTGSVRAKTDAVTIAAALVTAAVGYGVWRLDAPRASETATIGLAAADEPPVPVASTEPAAREALAAYARQLDELGARGATIALAPETVVAVGDADFDAVAAPFADVAKRRGTEVVVGLDRRGAGDERNTAVVWSPDDTVTSYVKQHLLPPFEKRYRPGTGLSVLGEPASPWGVAVCKDMDFPALGRAYGARGVTLLVVPAWDFGVDGWLHSRMAIMRGVESGFAVARSARNGALTLSDDRGRVVAETTSASAPVASLVATVPLERTDTPYRRYGDWLAWACAAAALCATAALARRG
jgi:apolipoprotein N-acyltransferase